MRQGQRIAVIGSGIGGLAAAWLLRQNHEVTLFERHRRPGMGVFGVDYDSRGRITHIDIPTRVFCEDYYPQLFALLATLGVGVRATDHAAAYADARGEVFFHYGNLRVLGYSLTYPRATSGRPRPLDVLRTVRDSLRFFPAARRDLERDAARLARWSFGEYLDAAGYSTAFTRGVLLPTLSVICTCDYDGVRAYPADLILRYLACGVMKHGVLCAELGVDAIVARLVEGAALVCGAAVVRVTAATRGYQVHTTDGQALAFDCVVLATQAHQAAEMLDDALPHTALLRRIPFERSMMRVHTDADVLPRMRGPLSPVTYHVQDGAPRPEVTVDMTRAFDTYRDQAPVFQTWNPIRPVREDSVLAEATFTRPRVTHDSRWAVAELHRLQAGAADPGLLFCGAYMADRMPLLEAAVESAVVAAERLGVRAPWSAAA